MATPPFAGAQDLTLLTTKPYIPPLSAATHRQSDQHATRGPNLALSGVRRTLKNNGATVDK